MDNNKIGPRSRIRFKLLTERQKPPNGGTLAFRNRPELYQVLGRPPGDEGER